MKAALSLLTLATVAISSTQAVDYDQTVSNTAIIDIPQLAQNATTSWAPQVRYLSSLARGFIQGYRRGMYKDNNYRVSNNCFDQSTQTAFTSVLDASSKMTFDWNTQLSNLIYTLKSVTDNCEYDESLYDYLTYCYEGDMCEPQNMMGTLLKKVFQVTTIANDLAQVYAEGLPNEQSSTGILEDFGERMGANVGKLLRYATEFDPNQINVEKLYE